MYEDDLSLEDLSTWLKLRSGEELFAPGDDWRLNALPRHITRRLAGHIIGYRDAADAIVEAVGQRIVPMSDFLAYPLVALYHHAVELQLKDLLFTAYGLVSRPISDNLWNNLTGKKGHEIGWLWAKARPPLDDLLQDSDKRDLDLIGEYLLVFSRMPYDFGRYPVRRDGSPVEIPDEYETINLVTLRHAMTRLLSALGGVATYLEELHNAADW